MNDQIDTLQGIAMFDGLSTEDMQRLTEVAQIMEFEPGELILHEGGNGQNLWVVLEGECEVYKHQQDGTTPGNSVLLAELGPHSHFGELSFFHAALHSADVKAKTHVRVFRLTRKAFDALAKAGSCAPYKLAYNAMATVSERLRRMDKWVTELLDHSQIDNHHMTEWEQFRQKLFPA